jgi:hypothetical protein
MKNTVTPWVPLATSGLHQCAAVMCVAPATWPSSTDTAATARSESMSGKRGCPGGGATTASTEPRGTAAVPATALTGAGAGASGSAAAWSGPARRRAG